MRQYDEERKACDDMQRINSGDASVREWNVELEEWKALIQHAMEFGTEKEVWHAKGAECSRCKSPLVEVELTVCDKCKGGKMLPPERY